MHHLSLNKGLDFQGIKSPTILEYFIIKISKSYDEGRRVPFPESIFDFTIFLE